MTAKQGDLVEVVCKDETIKGVLMPSKDKFVVVKLDSGYNIGIAKRNIKNIKSIGKKLSSLEKPVAPKSNKKLSKVTILHTGGTIASKVDYNTGAVIAKFKPEELLGMFPEIGTLANISSRMLTNTLSSNMRFAHYNLIAQEIGKEAKNGVKGIIVPHGTDTLHYTAAALSFILENINIPVVLVGSQRSSDRPSSDATINLISAIIFITQAKLPGVYVCMHENMEDDKCLVFHGCKVRKMHTSRRDAFKAVNSSAIAKIDYKKKKVDILNKEIVFKPKDGLEIKPFKDNVKVGILKTHTNMFADEFLAYKNFDGLVIEGTGLGHAPAENIDTFTKEHDKIYKAISSLAGKMPVVMTSQCIYGRVNMNVYSYGRRLQEAGVLGNNLDMTSETAFIKLAWLLSNNKKEVQELFSKNLRGEISERTEENFFC
ncbi:MAG: Glu-tRNA(Gln) amidotransferase subunit GatD [archaeon]